jgi:hypothetical protein
MSPLSVVILLIELLSSKWRVFQLDLIVNQLESLDGSTSDKYNEILLFIKEDSIILLSACIHLRFLRLVWFIRFVWLIRLVELINDVADKLVLLEVPLYNAILGSVS